MAFSELSELQPENAIQRFFNSESPLTVKSCRSKSWWKLSSLWFLKKTTRIFKTLLNFLHSWTIRTPTQRSEINAKVSLQAKKLTIGTLIWEVRGVVSEKIEFDKWSSSKPTASIRIGGLWGIRCKEQYHDFTVEAASEGIRSSIETFIGEIEAAAVENLELEYQVYSKTQAKFRVFRLSGFRRRKTDR